MLYQSFILFSSNSLILKYKHFTHLDTRAGVFQGKFDVCRGLYERTGCPPIFVYPLTKILWFKEGKGFRDFKRITFVKDYIIYRLSNTWIRMTSALGVAVVTLRALGYYSSIDAVGFEHVKGKRLGVAEPEPSICEALQAVSTQS